jgi:nicotinamidase/pyrazinamidase
VRGTRTDSYPLADPKAFLAATEAAKKVLAANGVTGQGLPKYGTQVLWPDHCVQGTEGAALHKDLSIPHAQLMIRKGFHKDTDSYSAFLEADRKTATGLAGYLKARGIKRVYLAGLATDFCVAWSALDARKAGFEAAVIEDACRGIDLNGSLAKAWADMGKAGVKRIKSADIAA